MKESISNLRTILRQEMDTKLDVIKTNGKQIEEGLTTFDLSVTSVIHALTAEGTKIKAMVDRHIEKMIATLKEKASHEKDSLTKMLSDCKQQLENAKAIEKREEKVRQSIDDASTIQHLQKLNDEISKLSVELLPEFPSVKYSPRSTSDSDVGQLIETYSLRYAHV
jgi:flagellar motility protein MotE (MotC chaperone)